MECTHRLRHVGQNQIPLSLQIDWNNPDNVMIARAAFFVVQVLILGTWFYIKQYAASVTDTTVIWVPDAASNNPMMKAIAGFTGGDAAPTKYEKTTRSEHVQKAAAAGLQQAITGAAMTFGMSMYFGFVTPLTMQVVTGPMNLYNNALFKWALMGKSLESRPFEERYTDPEQFESDAAGGVIKDGDEVPAPATTVTDASNNAAAKSSGPALKGAALEMEEAIFRTWERKDDVLNVAMVEAAIAAGADVNQTTREGQWTMLMVAAGNPKQHTPALQKLLTLGASMTARDEDGQNALHWAAYRNASSVIRGITEWAKGKQDRLQALQKALQGLDTSGRTPAAVADAEDNEEAAAALALAGEAAGKAAVTAAVVTAVSNDDDEGDVDELD